MVTTGVSWAEERLLWVPLATVPGTLPKFPQAQMSTPPILNWPCLLPRDPVNLQVLQAFVDCHEFANLNLVQALR